MNDKRYYKKFIMDNDEKMIDCKLSVPVATFVLGCVQAARARLPAAQENLKQLSDMIERALINALAELDGERIRGILQKGSAPKDYSGDN